MAISGEDDLLVISFRSFVYVIVALPSLALFICISLAMTLHFEEATRTHCNVDNWLPSISAAVASFSPERYIWRVLIGLHSAPRFVAAIAFRNLIMTCPLRPLSSQTVYNLLCHMISAFNISENFFLLLLTSVSSVENHGFHKSSFLAFIVTSLIHMFSASAMFHYSGRRRTCSSGERSFQYKVLTCSSSLISVIASMYFFYRHNHYCEPGVYTMFAISEYAFVLSNILFHSTMVFDFYEMRFILVPSGPAYRYHTLLPSHNTDKRMS